MCIICASAAGVPQPSMDALRRMFTNNPHGAGYMVARDGHVEISKGYMDWASFSRAIRYEAFGPADAVVYHFRISTQAGVNPEMTHPFPITADIENTRLLELQAPMGAAHNGIIRLTTDPTDRTYSDTAHYVAEFLRYFVRDGEDLRNPAILEAIERTTQSKWAIMDGSGYIAILGGGWVKDRGILYSNSTFRAVNYRDCGGRTVSKIYAGGRNYEQFRLQMEPDAYDEDDEDFEDMPPEDYE